MTALPEPQRGRIRELDGVRGVAILLVLLWHYVICAGASPPPLFYFLNVTWSGVDLFFVLSGFLIGGILLDHRDAPNYFAVFYRRRICRIFPIYYAWLLLFVVVSRLPLPLGAASGWLFADPMPLWSYATFTQNFLQAGRGTFGAAWLSVTWSLAVEEQFYLVLPLIVRFIPERLLPILLAPFLVIAPLVRAMLYQAPGAGPTAYDVTAYVLLICHADALVLGVLCAWLLRRRRMSAAFAPLLRIVLLSCGGFVLLAQYVPETKAFTILKGSILAFAFTALMMIAVVTPASPVARLMRLRWLRWLGMISYGTYILHQPILGLVWGVARGDWPHFLGARDLVLPPIALAIVLAAAAASYRWFERPILEYGRRWNYDATLTPSPPAAIPEAGPAAAPPSQAPPLP